MLDMEAFSEAVVGVPGEGLNIEQRKLLTIGVELAAKPALLLFLDEPTSGLDSQSSWAIVSFLRKLADNGQAVLATIHQPSAILFQEFDRLLLHQVWKESDEAKGIQAEISRIQQEMGHQSSCEDDTSHSEFAMPFHIQLMEVLKRVFQQYWRTPGYAYSKFALGIASALFIGFSFFHADASQQGLQGVIFSIFMITTILTTLVQQIMPRFILQRDLYEFRERPSKTYSWKAFIIANIAVEIPYQILLASGRQGLILLLLIQFFVFTSTFAHMLISALPEAETAGNIATLIFALTLTFNGVFQPPQALPGSGSSYLISAIASTGLSGRKVTCPVNELAIMQPPAGHSCGAYLQPYATAAGGSIYNPDAMSDCQYCPSSNSDQFLSTVAISYSTGWERLRHYVCVYLF
ncbi:hypothetical protein DID88_003062 [Monilinia fructigena]|uniref:ABC-2 type transporter transmembrane domain-containing protein n=1 Tax=Monilinia fructigena TaxID=38457 RepID=A0A395IEA3_9HELO|nr:hypothetical protein DID88_003062 [Monilinia fructigena]